MSFAEKTSVSVASSRADIETVLTRYGATSFASGWDRDIAVIQCEVKGRRIRFELRLPPASDKRFEKNGQGSLRSPISRKNVCEQEHRRLFRALLLVIKAKLESVSSGIETFEQAFLANIVLPGGHTFGEWAVPQIARAYDEGVTMPSLLLGAGK